MKKHILKTLCLQALLFTSIGVNAGSNNGYTTAANVYSGSSSRTWYGGGVQHVLAEWRKEADASAEQESVVEEAEAVSSEEVAPAPAEVTNNETEMPPETATTESTEAIPESPTPPTAPSINE